MSDESETESVDALTVSIDWEKTLLSIMLAQERQYTLHKDQPANCKKDYYVNLFTTCSSLIRLLLSHENECNQDSDVHHFPYK